jgi:hypothetical protein
MPNITVPDVTIRTTSDGPGHPHGLIFGPGPTLDGAVMELRQDAGLRAREIAEQFSASTDEHADRPDAVWRFEVIDVRFQPGPDDEGGPGWVAYGTLVSDGANPWASGFSDQQN